jgi:hypothetical protein
MISSCSAIAWNATISVPDKLARLSMCHRVLILSLARPLQSHNISASTTAVSKIPRVAQTGALRQSSLETVCKPLAFV